MKTVVVTGAAQGVGLVTTRHFAELGWHVVMTDIQPLESQAAELVQHGHSVSHLSGDQASPDFVAALAEQVRSENGQADALVNNAGISMICPAEDTSLDQWNRVLSVNLTGPFLLCQAFGAQMLAGHGGAIVNVASIAGLRGVIHRSAYNASKHGLVGLTHTLASEWGGRGVRVNAVCPGWIKTEMDEKDMGSGAYTDADIVNRVPMARFARPEDVASAIAYLCSDGAVFINGVSLPVDGGWTADASWDALRLKTRA